MSKTSYNNYNPGLQGSRPCLVQRSVWHKGQRNPEKLADFQVQPLQSTGMVISNIQEAKQVWQE